MRRDRQHLDEEVAWCLLCILGPTNQSAYFVEYEHPKGWKLDLNDPHDFSLGPWSFPFPLLWRRSQKEAQIIKNWPRIWKLTNFSCGLYFKFIFFMWSLLFFTLGIERILPTKMHPGSCSLLFHFWSQAWTFDFDFFKKNQTLIQILIPVEGQWFSTQDWIPQAT